MLDWIAGGLELIAQWTVGDKKRIGYCVFWICEVLWVIVAFQSKRYGLILAVVPAFFINVRNFRKWGNKKKMKMKKLLIEI